MKLKLVILLGISALFISILCLGRYLATNQPVKISMKFDTASEILSITLKNEGDSIVNFYDSLSPEYPKKGSEYLENLPSGLCVKLFSKGGQLLSKGGFPEGCITARYNLSTIRSNFARPLTPLSPNHSLSRIVKLEDLIGSNSEFANIQDVCVQFILKIYFDKYAQFPVTTESEVVCVNQRSPAKSTGTKGAK